MSALIAKGKVPAIKGGRGAGKAAKVKTIGLGKKGSIVISKDLVESLGIGANDKFTVRKTKLGTYEVSGWTGYPIKKIRRCCPS
jgi:hypothetical protein